MKIYEVGGAVRDSLLGLEPKDIDYVVVGSNPTELVSLGFTQVGSSFPVFLHPTTNEEYALARTEKKIGTGYHGFECEWENVTLEQDLQRRDITINAIAYDVHKEEYIDPYFGIQDLEHKIIRHCNNKSFTEDPLRILRVARFTAKLPDFTVYHGTIKLIKETELEHLTPERITLETDKALMSEKPSNYFRFLLDNGKLETLFPILYRMTQLEHRSAWHIEGSVFEHTMLVIDEASKLPNKNLKIMYGALYHDIGKTQAYEEFEHKNGFHGHEDIDITRPLCGELKKTYKLPNDISRVIQYCSTYHSFLFSLLDKEMKVSTIVKKLCNGTFPKTEEDIDILFSVSISDNKGRITKNPYILPSNDYLQNLIGLCASMNKVSAKGYISKYKEENEGKEPKLEAIKQYLHRERIHKFSKSFT